MHDVVLVLVIASFIIYGACVLSKKNRALEFFSIVTAGCAIVGLLVDRADLGDYFAAILLPLAYALLESIARLVVVKGD